MTKWFLLAVLAIVATIVDQIVIHYHYGSWAYIFSGWFVVWIGCFLILRRRWLPSIAAVVTLSVIEDALFLFWDRIVGRTSWDASWYCHDWMLGVSQDWGGVPSHYVYSLVIAGCLLWLARRRQIRINAEGKYL